MADTLTHCRACQTKNPYVFMPMGNHPPANMFVRPDEVGKEQPSSPLNTQVCLNCGLIQVADQVPEDFFRHYLYVPSGAATMHSHFAELAKTLEKRAGGELIVDIGCNDGLMLAAANMNGSKTLGIAPAANLAKIAGDVAIMMTTERSEVAEPFVRHRGASSTMPQKANPISCELILAGARLMRNHASAMLDAMIHDHERATGPWHLEFSAVPEGFATISGMLAQAEFMLEGLRVYPENMGRNLDHSRGLIVAEAVMMALAPHTGRKEAHDIVYAGCRRAVEGSISLYDALKDEVVLTSHLEGEVLKSLTEPRNYLGEAPEMVDRVLAGR